MPFTFSHPALVLPFSHSRFKLSLSGLVAGSMVPDFEYYLRLGPGPTIGHGLLGFFAFDIPVAIMMVFVFHSLIRNIFYEHLPDYLRSRFNAFRNFNWTRYFLDNKIKVIASVSIGIVSHLFWDAFTHYDGIFVLIYPILTSEITLFQFQMPFYSIFQIGSSIIGLIVLLVYFAIMPTQKIELPLYNPRYIYWLMFIGLGLVIYSIRYFLYPNFIYFWDYFMAVTGSFLYAWIITSLLFSFYFKIGEQEVKQLR